MGSSTSRPRRAGSCCGAVVAGGGTSRCDRCALRGCSVTLVEMVLQSRHRHTVLGRHLLARQRAGPYLCNCRRPEFRARCDKVSNGFGVEKSASATDSANTAVAPAFGGGASGWRVRRSASGFSNGAEPPQTAALTSNRSSRSPRQPFPLFAPEALGRRR